jgi:hypothetical protein
MIICPLCKKECTPIRIDDGIGPYEWWGFKGIHHDWRIVSDCCHEDVDPEQEKKDE